MVRLSEFRYYSLWHSHANQRLYDATADPWAQISVDPTNIDHFSVVSLIWGLGRVEGGDWDRPNNCRGLFDTKMYDGLRQHFVDGRAWKETAYHDWVVECIESDGHFRGYETAARVVEERYPCIDDLYADMCEDGYRPNHGNLYGEPAEVSRIHELDPMVLLGRSGEVIWTEGFHRLFLAQFAGIGKIPVYVLRRHEEWQRVRDRIAVQGGAVPADLTEHATHPDLQDVIDREPRP